MSFVFERAAIVKDKISDVPFFEAAEFVVDSQNFRRIENSGRRYEDACKKNLYSILQPINC